MNYQLIYDNLILRAANRSKKDAYYENHHIVPKCIGGTNAIHNLALLTPEEHYVAHQLLVKMHPTNHRIIWAANMMTVNSPNSKRNNKVFGWLRRKMAENGRKQTPETIAKMIATKASRTYVVSDETRKKKSILMTGNQISKGVKHTEETKAKMRGRTYTTEQLAVFSQRRKEYWERKKSVECSTKYTK